MDQKVNPIQPPPSVDDLLALGPDARLGQVDFANRLVSTTGKAQAAPSSVDGDIATVTSVLPRQRPVAAVPELPEIAPPAPEPVAEAAVEVVPEVVVEPEAEAVVEPEPVSPTFPAAALAPMAKPAARSRPKPAAKAKPAPKAKPEARTPRASQPVAEPIVEATAEPIVEPVIPAILPIANLSGDAVSASAAYDDEFFDHERPAEPAGTDTAPTLQMPAEPVQAARTRPWTRAVAPAPAPAPVTEDSPYFGGTVQEVADAAIERLRDAENATLQHLAALETEAARRAELLTAQAELDAELIRITARREAHAIISAARTQAGLGAPSSRDARQLSEISDAVSRFAESIESTLAPMHQHPSGDRA